MENSQNIIDPREEGLQGLSGIRPNRFLRSEQELHDMELFMEESSPARDLRSFRDQGYREAPVTSFIGTPGLGDSRFDSKMDWASDFDNLQDNRGRLQTGAELLGIGVLKGAVLAGTTFLDGVLGTAVGAISAAAGGSFINNPWSVAMQDINAWSEDALPSYYRDHELAAPWYRNIFTANFIGDKFVKNLGFAVGAAYSGRAVFSVGSKVLQLDKARKAYKGASLAAREGSNYAAQAASPASLARELSSKAALLKGKENVLKMTAAISAGMGEARIEAIGTSDEYINEQTAKLDLDLALAMDNERLKLMEEGAHEYFELVHGIDGLFSVELTAEGRNAIYERLRGQHEEALALIHRDAASIGNVAFATNTALLTASDWIQFGKFYAGGYKAAKRSAANVARDAAGKYIPKAQRAKAVGNIIKNPIVEGNEEMMQSVSALGAGYMYENDSYFASALDPEANRETVGYLKAMGKALVESYSDIGNYEEFFIGFLTGGLGVPSFGGMQGGIAGEVRLMRAEQTQNQKVADELNKIWTPEAVEYYKGLVRNNTYESLKELALREGDEFQYKNHEAEQLLSNVLMYDAAGRILDLIDIVDGFGEISSEADIDQLRADTVDKATGKSIYDGMTNELIIESVRNQANHYKDIIKDYQDISSDLLTVTGEDYDADGLNELTWMLTKVKDWERRFALMHRDILHHTRDITFTDSEGNTISAAALLRLSPKDFLNLGVKEIGNTVSLADAKYKAIADKIDKAESDLKNLKGKRSKKYLDAQKELELLRQKLDKESDATIDSKVALRLLLDMLKTLLSRAEFIDRFNEFITTPSALKLKIKEVLKRAQEHQKANEAVEELKKDIPTSIALRDAKDLTEFKAILDAEPFEGFSANEIKEKKRALADNLSKQNHPIAMAYMDISNTGRGMLEAIRMDISVQYDSKGNLINSYPALMAARRIILKAMTLAESGNLLRDINDPIYLEVIKEVNEDGELAFPDLDLAEKSLDIVKLSIDMLDTAANMINFKGVPKAGEAASANVEGVQHKKELMLVPSAREVTARKDKKEEPKTEPTGTSTSTKKAAPVVITPISDNEMVDSFKKENTMSTRSEETEYGTQDRPLPYWKASFSEHDLPSIKNGDPVLLKNSPRWAPIKAMWDALALMGTWKYVNEGKLKESDTIHFGIDPRVLLTEGINGIPILIYKGDLVIGVLPETTAANHEEMKPFIDSLRKEYEEFVNKDPGNDKKIFKSTKTSVVTEVMPGRNLFTTAKNRLLGDVKNIRNRPITFTYVKSGIEHYPNAKDNAPYVGLIDPSDKEGRLYYRILGADGVYYPVAVNVKHFNDGEFSLQNEENQKTQVYKNLSEAAGLIYDHVANGLGLFSTPKDTLNNILYFGGEISFFLTTSLGLRSVEITVKNTEGEKLFSEFIIIGSPSQEIVSMTDSGPVRDGRMTENTLRDRDAVISEILLKLQSHNPRFLVNGNMLNAPGYNEQLINDGILFTNLVDAVPGSAWFKMAPVREDGTVFSDKDMGKADTFSKTKEETSGSTNTFGGTETVANYVEVEFKGLRYKIGRDLSLPSNAPVVARGILEDLALIKMHATGLPIEGTRVVRNKTKGTIRLQRPDGSVVWFLLKSDRKTEDGIPQPVVNDVGYLDQVGSQEAEAEYIKSIGEDAYNELMGIKEKVKPAPVKEDPISPETDKINERRKEELLGKTFAATTETVITGKGRSAGKTLVKFTESKISSDGKFLIIKPKANFKNESKPIITTPETMTVEEFKQQFYENLSEQYKKMFDELFTDDSSSIRLMEARIGLKGSAKGQVKVEVQSLEGQPFEFELQNGKEINDRYDAEIDTLEAQPSEDTLQGDPISPDIHENIHVTMTSDGYHDFTSQGVNTINSWSRKLPDPRNLPRETGWGEHNGNWYYKKMTPTGSGRPGDNTTIWFSREPSQTLKEYVEGVMTSGQGLNPTELKQAAFEDFKKSYKVQGESLQAQESGLIHYPEYDDTSKEGVKDWVPVRKAIRGGEGRGYANTFGKKVEIPGFESFDFYVMPDTNNKNKYIVIEGSTGLGVILDPSTIKGAVALATEKLNQNGLAKLQEVLSQIPIINEKSPSAALLLRVQEDAAPKEEAKATLSKRSATPPANVNRFSKIAKRAGIKVNENFKDESTISTDLVLIDGRANPNASFEAFSALAKAIAPKSNGAKLTRSDWNSLTAQEREHEINCIAPF